MMGELTVAQEALFYTFSLERHVPADHLLRSIDRFCRSVGHSRASAPLPPDCGEKACRPRCPARERRVG